MNEPKKRGSFLIVTGMSGAGKSTVLKMLEDEGVFCVDNLPARLLPFLINPPEEEGEPLRIAAGIDIRNGTGLNHLLHILPELKKNGAKVLFLEAVDESLIMRYKETRRLHPLSGEGRMDRAIALEREKLSDIKKNSDFIIDTSRMLTRELKAYLGEALLKEEGQNSFVITLLSFGFKHGLPSDADLVFDVRFLPNPYYDEALRPQTGNDTPVYDFVMKQEKAKEFLEKMKEMLLFLLPEYKKEGKTNLVVAIGCTGGRHRSVTLANALYKELQDKDYLVRIEHREIG